MLSCNAFSDEPTSKFTDQWWRRANW